MNLDNVFPYRDYRKINRNWVKNEVKFMKKHTGFKTSHCYEIIAKHFGFNNWNVMSAMIAMNEVNNEQR